MDDDRVFNMIEDIRKEQNHTAVELGKISTLMNEVKKAINKASTLSDSHNLRSDNLEKDLNAFKNKQNLENQDVRRQLGVIAKAFKWVGGVLTAIVIFLTTSLFKVWFGW